MATPFPSEAIELPSHARFLNADAARSILRRLRDRLPHEVFESLLTFLPAAPAADPVLAQFERLLEASRPELISLLQKFPFLVHYTVLLFGHSEWLGETLIRNQDLLAAFIRERKGLHRARTYDEFADRYFRTRARSMETETAALLSRFKKREYIRIVLRDVLGIATLSDVTAEVSSLSDVLIEAALREVEAPFKAKHGARPGFGNIRPSRFSVLSLGKLGGSELNYSSDIDLMFLYDAEAEAAGSLLTSREYFIRLAQQTTELLSRHNPEGPVFRIDLRLRPQGSQEELAVSLSHAIRYYREVAQDWELQALIKARHSAGDATLSREFIRAVEPHVYRPELNFTAIKTALQTREKIDKRRRRHPAAPSGVKGIDVKLDRGGIRDIEFLVQCLQRIYGGSESWLRSRGTLFALQKLHDKDHISGKDFHNLTNAYEYLRNVEHRLQLRNGQQTHRLPESRPELEALGRSLMREGADPPTPEEFVAHVQRRMAAVAEIYQRVIYREQSQDQGAADFQLWPEAAATPESTYSQIMQRLAIDSPQLREIASRVELSQHARRNLDRFLSSAGTTSERYGAVLRSPDAVEKALTAFEFSEFLTEILVRHPEEVSLLDEVEQSVPTDGDELFAAEGCDAHAANDPVFQFLSSGKVDGAEATAVLRQQYRRRVVLSGALDLFRSRDVFEALRDNTAAADAAIQAALAIAGAPAGFAVLGLGRLGAVEFDLLSDADVLFVCDNGADRDAARRAAERLMEALTAYTRDGTVFSVDARLRPHGREGELVVTPTQLETYFRDEAQPWEALTYAKLRHVAGDGGLGQRTIHVVQQGATDLAARTGFVAELNELRTRLERSDSSQNLKSGPGGIYDIDYLAGSLQVRQEVWLVGNLTERLRALREKGLLEEEDYRALIANAHFLRTLEHVVRLVTGRARKWLPVADHPRRAVQKLLWRMLSADESFDPEMRLREVMQQTREIYGRYVSGEDL